MGTQKLLAILAFSLFSTVVTAADSKQLFSAKSVATLSCKHYLNSRQKGGNEYALYGGFLGGYISAYNQHVPGTFDLTPWENVETLANLVANYCLKNPAANFGVAVNGLVSVLQPTRLTAASDKILMENGSHSVALYAEVLRRVQTRLGATAGYTGDAHGRYDTATRSALESYQRAHELAVTGLPDQETLYYMYYR